MNRVADDMAVGESALGHSSMVVDPFKVEEYGIAKDAEIHVCHTHIPDIVDRKKAKVVWIGHGTPEHCFQNSVAAGLSGGYAPGDSWMVVTNWLRLCDAAVTFWPRHREIWQSLCPKKGIQVELVPLGIDRELWQPVETRGKFAGTPSVFTAENCHYIKWPLDLVFMWPWIVDQMPEARLHLSYLPRDQHKFWFPLMNANGSSFKAYINDGVYAPPDLRNAFVSTDYYCGLVRYGDFNRIGLEAKASGSKVISYCGNEYADYWISEGDQRDMTKQTLEILRGEIPPRPTLEVPTITEMTAAMVKIYETL
jgi:hypothetical protein